jgi:leader peptidase (prepilin peptidase)/N-methyltransferase
MEKLLLVFSGLFGLVIGSFLNVVIYRLPRKMPMAWERSVCPRCQQQLRWHHNIPLLSYLVLRGRCAFCRQRISVRYPLVELLNALVFVWSYWQYGLSLDFCVSAFLGAVLLVVFFIDLDFQIIPDVITLPGIALGIAVSLAPGGLGLIKSVTGVIVGGGSLYVIALLGDWLFKKDSMGGGDIKLAGMLGAFLGWQKIVFVFIAAAFIGMVISIGIMAFSAKFRRHRVVPFGPFLATAALIAMVYGDRIISFYAANFLSGR